MDGRVFQKAEEDVHNLAGMGCTDCQGSREIMSNGNSCQHMEEATKVQCTDCHKEIHINSIVIDSTTKSFFVRQ